MHSRMRHRVKEFQKVLNRAKMEKEETGEKERKTVTYVFLTRSVKLTAWLMRSFSTVEGPLLIGRTMCRSGRQ